MTRRRVVLLSNLNYVCVCELVLHFFFLLSMDLAYLVNGENINLRTVEILEKHHKVTLTTKKLFSRIFTLKNCVHTYRIADIVERRFFRIFSFGNRIGLSRVKKSAWSAHRFVVASPHRLIAKQIFFQRSGIRTSAKLACNRNVMWRGGRSSPCARGPPYRPRPFLQLTGAWKPLLPASRRHLKGCYFTCTGSCVRATYRQGRTAALGPRPFRHPGQKPAPSSVLCLPRLPRMEIVKTATQWTVKRTARACVRPSGGSNQCRPCLPFGFVNSLSTSLRRHMPPPPPGIPRHNPALRPCLIGNYLTFKLLFCFHNK